MTNIERVKKAIKESSYFNNNFVSDSSCESEVHIITKKVFISFNELSSLKMTIEMYNGVVEEIYVSTMPALKHDLCVIVLFKN